MFKSSHVLLHFTHPSIRQYIGHSRRSRNARAVCSPVRLRICAHLTPTTTFASILRSLTSQRQRSRRAPAPPPSPCHSPLLASPLLSAPAPCLGIFLASAALRACRPLLVTLSPIKLPWSLSYFDPQFSRPQPFPQYAHTSLPTAGLPHDIFPSIGRS